MIPEFVKKIDLIALIESDLGPGVITGNKWKKFNCPYCRSIRRDEKKFLLVTNGDDKRGGWWTCKYCNTSGDAVTWLMKKRRMSFLDAIDYLRKPHVKHIAPKVPVSTNDFTG